MIKAIPISIILHIAVLLTYPSIDLREKRDYRENATVSFMEISEESFSAIGDKLPERTSDRLSQPEHSMVWEVPWPAIHIEFLKNPEDIGSVLKKDDKELPEIEIHEKETPPLREELEIGK